MFAGNKIALSLFGESHGEKIGITLEGIPAGVRLDAQWIQRQMLRRRSVNALSTPRREPDKVEIVSGVTGGVTNGGTITALIANTNTQSGDYDPAMFRPSHSDYVANGKYQGANDHRGGGFFSGRLTAPLVFAGAICQQLLQRQGVVVGAHVLRIGEVCDQGFDMVNTTPEELERVRQKEIPLIDDSRNDRMTKVILEAKEHKDSVGGILECMALGLPPFVGGAYFDRLQSKLAGLIFSIPSFLGLEFGIGFAGARLRGSEVNDPLHLENGRVKTRTNNSGGINGGITNGMPIVLRVAVRPTPSIGREQTTLDWQTKENTQLQIAGRHDPCIVIRAAVVLESMVALGLYDSWEDA